MPVSGLILAALFSRPAVFFTLLAALNTLLAYSPLDWGIKLAVGLLGFGILGFFYLKNQPPAPLQEQPLFTRELFTPVIWWIYLILGLALVVRLYKLTSFLSFPILDEIVNAYSAIHLNGHGGWPFFYYSSQLPPLYLWLLTEEFKFGGVSFQNLWLVPAFLSFLAIVIYYRAFRVFFSKSFSFLCLVLLGISFWPVYIGRFSHNAVLMVFCQALAFWILAKFLSADSNRNHPALSIFLGFCLGLGFYTYFAWPLIALCVILTLGWFFRRSWPNRKWDLFLFLAAAFLTVLPLAIAALRENFGAYIRILFAFNQKGDETYHWHYWQNAFLFTNLFWTGQPWYFLYNSGWGGLLNPILGSLFFMGTAEWWRLRWHPLAKWMAGSAAVLFLPCLLANNINGYHLAPLLPLFIATMALGLGAVLGGLPNGPARFAFILPVFFLSIGLDHVTLEKSMAVANRDFSDTNPRVALCESLKKHSQTSGPGLVYSDFSMDEWLPVYLNVGTYSFNTLANPSLDSGKVSWAAIIADDGCRPHLTRLFPDAVFTDWKSPSPSDSNLQAIIPLNPANRKILEGWNQADRDLRELNFLLLDHPFTQPLDKPIRYLLDRESDFQGDSFLKFYYWGKLANNYYWDKKYTLALTTFQKALSFGSNGLLNYNLAQIFGKAERYSEAKKALLEAAKWDSIYQPPPQLLQKLDELAAHANYP